MGSRPLLETIVRSFADHIEPEAVCALVERAVAAGARLRRPVKDEFYGDRSAQLEDPFGHRWNFCTRIEEVSPAEMQRRLAALTAG